MKLYINIIDAIMQNMHKLFMFCEFYFSLRELFMNFIWKKSATLNSTRILLPDKLDCLNPPELTIGKNLTTKYFFEKYLTPEIKVIHY